MTPQLRDLEKSELRYQRRPSPPMPTYQSYGSGPDGGESCSFVMEVTATVDAEWDVWCGFKLPAPEYLIAPPGGIV